MQDLITGVCRRSVQKGLPDGVNDDHIVHHDDDPGQAAQDESECDHDENQGQSLFTRTDES